MTLMRLPDPYYTDPATGRAGPGFASIELTNTSPTMAHDLNDGSTVVAKVAAAYWEANISYTDLTPEEMDVIGGFLLRLEGRLTPFQIMLPQYRYPKAGALGLTEAAAAIVNVSTRYAAGSTSVKFTNWKNIVPGIEGKELAVGDMVKFAGKSKVYMVTSTTYSALANNGEMTLGLMPPLANTVDIGDKLVTDDLLFTVRLKNDNVAMSLNSDLYYSGFSLALKEDSRGYTY